jgi:LmbE family N-acetylglucosaminyl deacetylase
MTHRLRIVFAVCHADDEAIWVGGLLHGLAHLPEVDVTVACLSGAGPRTAEFEAARRVAGYQRGVLLDLPLRPAPDPLPPTADLLESALKQLELAPDQIDLLVTHSPYGDEHVHPHHRQAHRELRAWGARNDVPFAFFTPAASPFLVHRSVIRDLRRRGPLHLLQFARCRPAVHGLLMPPGSGLLGRARWYAQFLGDADVKRRMLECYASVDQGAFHGGYAMYTSAAESLYLADDRGAAVIRSIEERLDVPSPIDLFARSGPSAALPTWARMQTARLLRRRWSG